MKMNQIQYENVIFLLLRKEMPEHNSLLFISYRINGIILKAIYDYLMM
jgi:hypothetical protein